MLLFAVSFPAWLIVMYSRIGRVMQYGYFVANFGAEPAIGLSHLPELLAEALPPAMIFLIAASKARRAMRRFALAGMAIFGAATLFTGSKGPAVMAFLAFGWVWHRSIRRLRPALLLAGAIALAVIVIPLTTAVRETAGRDRASVGAVADAYRGIDNPVVAFLSETGWTGTTIAHTVEMIPAVRDFDYGLSYLYAGLAVLPNLGGGLRGISICDGTQDRSPRGCFGSWEIASAAESPHTRKRNAYSLEVACLLSGKIGKFINWSVSTSSGCYRPHTRGASAASPSAVPLRRLAAILSCMNSAAIFTSGSISKFILSP
jgi:hypothetical protein